MKNSRSGDSPKALLWGVRLAALLMVGTVLFALIQATIVNEFIVIGIVVPFGALVLPYSHILWGMRRGRNETTLRLAVVWGALIALAMTWSVASVYLFAQPDAELWLPVIPLSIITVNLGLFFSALILSLHSPRGEVRWKHWVRGAAVAAGYGTLVILLSAVFPLFPHNRMPVREAAAVGGVRILALCAEEYAEAHEQQGYPANLESMEVENPGCIDPVLLQAATGGESKSGYVFQYKAGEPSDDGMIDAFRIWGRPEVYGRDGERNYYSDESGSIHITKEDRPATKDDPVLR